MIRRCLLSLLVFLASFAPAQMLPTVSDAVNQWKSFLAADDVASLKSLYSTFPPAKYLEANNQPAPDISPETDFWQKLLSSGATNFAVTTLSEREQQNLHLVSLQVSMKMKTPNGLRTRYVVEQQAWQDQANHWRIVLASHTDVLKMRPALKPNPNLYDKNADARTEIKEALSRAAANHQRVILVFGANWCYDCHVLDQAFHEPDVAPLLQKNFRVVHVDIGDDGKKNNDLAQKYDIPLERGVPALAVLAPDGKLLYSQKNGEFEKARALDPDDVLAFLNKWKPQGSSRASGR